MSLDTLSTEIRTNLATVRANISDKCLAIGRTPETFPRLVAVSKTKPFEVVQVAYDCGHRSFGENYVQEIVEKACQLPPDIEWHFIGHLQSNKCKELVENVAGLHLVESVDSDRVASNLQKYVLKFRPTRPLGVLIQVNTSGQDSKSGVSPGAEVIALAQHISTQCPLLRLRGLMTIGMPDYTSKPENFECLVRCRKELAEAMGSPEAAPLFELSMGMSGDYVAAIEMGSTNVRVGSAIFGSRVYP